MNPTLQNALNTITAALNGVTASPAPVLESPPPTAAENAEAVKVVYAAIDRQFPTDGPPGPGMYPAESEIRDIYMIKDVTERQIADAYCLVLGFAGGVAPFNALRQQEFSGSHDNVSGRIRAFFVHPEHPIESDQVLTPPMEFPPTLSEAEIQRRAGLTPPVLYSGARSWAPEMDATFRPQAQAAITGATGKAWDKVPTSTIRVLGLSLWLPGLSRAGAWTGNPADIAGLTAAQVFLKYDQGLRGMQATD